MTGVYQFLGKAMVVTEALLYIPNIANFDNCFRRIPVILFSEPSFG